MVSKEAHKELQADQDCLRQEDYRNRELEPDNLQHKIAQEQFQQRPRKSEEEGKKMEKTRKKLEEMNEALKEEQERRRKAEEALDKFRSQLAKRKDKEFSVLTVGFQLQAVYSAISY